MKRAKPQRLVIGLDVGGTKTRGILWDGKKIVKIANAPTPQQRKEFVDMLRGMAASLAGAQSVKAIGLGVPGTVHKDMIVTCPNLPEIRDLDVRKIFPAVAKLKLDNDARCFARCEMLLGNGKGRGGSKRSLLAITIGTGIGRAFGTGGKIKSIEHFTHREAWEGAYQRQRDAHKPGLLAKLLAVKLAPIIGRLKPDTIVIGGSVIGQPGLLPLLQKELRREGVFILLKKAHFRDNAGAIGAALLVS